MLYLLAQRREQDPFYQRIYGTAIICSRWDRNSMETYGRGPGMEALAEIKMQ